MFQRILIDIQTAVLTLSRSSASILSVSTKALIDKQYD